MEDCAENPLTRRLRFLVVTAFDVGYEIGFLCSVVNEAYCKKHGYTFFRFLRSRDDMSKLSAGRHLAWGKVALLRHLLLGKPAAACEAPGICGTDYDYIVWIDADAVILNHSTSLEHFVSVAQRADFIIGEDMADTDFLNTGLMLFRGDSAWCKDLLHQWWENSDSKWHHEVCWDQTGLCKLLQARQLLGQQTHWFSWFGGPRYKQQKNMFVFDCGSFNFKYVNNCDFVFHAVGERELLFSFSRHLLLKKDRLCAAVHDGFVAHGQDFEADFETCLELLHGVSVDEARSQLQRALQFWRAFGTSRSGRQGRPPPCGWVWQVPPMESCAEVTRSRADEAAQQLLQVFAAGRPLVVNSASHWDSSEMTPTPESLASILGEMSVRLLRAAPPRAADADNGPVTYVARFWQLCSYVVGSPPPFSALSCTRKDPWRLCGWRPWNQLPQCSSALLEAATWKPPWQARYDVSLILVITEAHAFLATPVCSCSAQAFASGPPCAVVVAIRISSRP